MRSLQWERIRSRDKRRKRTTTREKKPRRKKAIRQGRFFWRHRNCAECGAESHLPAQPGDQGTRRSTLCYHENKGKETRGREKLWAVPPWIWGSKAHLLGKERKGSLKGFGRLRRERDFPAESWDAAELWTAPPEPDSRLGAPELRGSSRVPAPCWKPFLPVCSPLLDSDHRTEPGKSFYDPCPNVPGDGATLPLTRSGKRVSSSGNPVLVDNASPVKKEKFWGLVGGRRGKEDSGRKKVDGWLLSLIWKEWWPRKDVHQRPDYWEPLGSLCAGDRAGGVQRGRRSGQLQPGPPRAQAAAWRLVPGMERGVCTLSHFTLSLPLYGDGQCVCVSHSLPGEENYKSPPACM